MFLTNALFYHDLRHAYMVDAFSDLHESIRPYLIPTLDLSYSEVLYIDGYGNTQRYSLTDNLNLVSLLGVSHGIQ